MSHSISFRGTFTLNKALIGEHQRYLQRFAEIHHELLRVELLHPYPDPLREQVGLPPGPYGIYFVGIIDPFSVGDDLLRAEFADVRNYQQERVEAAQALVAPEESLWTYLRKQLGLENSPFEADGEKEQMLWKLWKEQKWVTKLLPDIWCHWRPTTDGKRIEAEKTDKFPFYCEWLQFLLDHFLIPWGYELSGQVEYSTDIGQRGYLLIEEQQVREIITQPAGPY
jgi:hypothetical protein